MKNVSTISVDLAKQSFQLLGIDRAGKISFSKRFDRSEFKVFLQQCPACLVVMESCATAHFWGRVAIEAGHQVNLIPAQHVTPFVMGNKNDKNDCMGIYEASRRPRIRFVPVKSEQQQAVLALHRVRERLVAARTACINQTCSLLLEFGLVVPKGFKSFYTVTADLLAQSLHPAIHHMVAEARHELNTLSEKIAKLEQQFKQYIQTTPAAQIIMSIPGIGVLNASAFSAAIDKGQAFKTPREFGVWLGSPPGSMRLANRIIWVGLQNEATNTCANS